jgi:hypothetical protein
VAPSGDITSWYVFEKPTEASEFENYLMFQLPGMMEDEPEKAAAFVAGFAKKHPRGAQCFATKLAEYGVPAAGKGTFEDHDASRLLAAYRAFLPIADLLLARAGGKKNAALSPTDTDVGVTVAKKDPTYLPNMLLLLLASALGGDRAGAEKQASAILKERLGVGLTRRWAELVLEKGRV